MSLGLAIVVHLCLTLIELPELEFESNQPTRTLTVVLENNIQARDLATRVTTPATTQDAPMGAQ